MTEQSVKVLKVVGIPNALLFPPPGCPGCQYPTVGRIVAEVLEELDVLNNSVAVMGVGCHAGMAMLNIDGMGFAHGRAPDTATAVKRLIPENLVFTFQGDGDCIAIGAGSFVGALGRGEKITIIMINNANYGTTGGQTAPTTLLGQVTTTAGGGRDAEMAGYPIHVAELAATFRGVAYSARGAVNSPANYQLTKRYIEKAFKKQLGRIGTSFVEVLSACPPNWHMSPVESLNWIEEHMIPEYPLEEFKDLERIE
ncbi:thiamine pyrophosphate-dependent enzyme [Chloroflexota bacterium]